MSTEREAEEYAEHQAAKAHHDDESEAQAGERVVFEFDGFRIRAVEHGYCIERVRDGVVTRAPEEHLEHEEMQAVLTAFDIVLVSIKRDAGIARAIVVCRDGKCAHQFEEECVRSWTDRAREQVERMPEPTPTPR